MKRLRKGSAAAKAWGAKMRRLRLGVASKPKRKKARRLRSVVNVARRRRSSRRASSGFGGRGLMSGLYHPKGIIASALLGAGAATLTEKVVNIHPLQGVAVGFIVGGVGGAAGAYARDMLKGTNMLGVQVGSAGNY